MVRRNNYHDILYTYSTPITLISTCEVFIILYFKQEETEAQRDEASRPKLSIKWALELAFQPELTEPKALCCADSNTV